MKRLSRDTNLRRTSSASVDQLDASVRFLSRNHLLELDIVPPEITLNQRDNDQPRLKLRFMCEERDRTRTSSTLRRSATRR